MSQWRAESVRPENQPAIVPDRSAQAAATLSQSTPSQSVAAVSDPPRKPHWSPSSMALYFRCGEAWRRRYIEKERQPPVLAMLKGTGMHRGAQHNFTQKIASQQDLPVEQIVAAAVAAFDEELAKGVTLSDNDQALGQNVAVGMARDDVANLAAAFAVFQAPLYQPVATELPYRIPVEKSTHDLVGVIDLVATVADAPGHHVRDFKTAKRRKSAVDSASSDQLTNYAAGHTIHYGFPPATVGLDVLVTLKRGVERQDLPETRDAADFKALANKINAMDAGVKAGVFLPADSAHWMCSAKMCEFHATCPFVNHARQVAATNVDE